MSAASEREKTAAAVRELGALPMPFGSPIAICECSGFVAESGGA